jgi:hypothetical protein
MPITIEAIQGAKDDNALFELLRSELDKQLPEGVREDWIDYSERLAQLPRGLRAMAGIYFFDVSMAMDDLAWHFGNQNDERELAETLNGLRELEMPEFADYFERMWIFFKPYMRELQTGEHGGKEFHEWLVDIGAQKLADPMNKEIWEYCEKHSDLRLLASWPIYARKYPERCVTSQPMP